MRISYGAPCKTKEGAYPVPDCKRRNRNQNDALCLLSRNPRNILPAPSLLPQDLRYIHRDDSRNLPVRRTIVHPPRIPLFGWTRRLQKESAGSGQKGTEGGRFSCVFLACYVDFP